ncbi:hypothetical protein Sp245p_22785 (plasmid) [Azospirillum baldaniorum]|uniref:Uncharacterized protein n=1 Tax=Azospirillum baldaniorum TaxID=1064539 RepID=A0A9P1JZQ0_9PROT|nr:hypothetical protein Sp245p_22785 [Azospirillum baldaniorum]CCD02804.1 protein of unknown function [Azospirillum baldaniorum]
MGFGLEAHRDLSLRVAAAGKAPSPAPVASPFVCRRRCKLVSVCRTELRLKHACFRFVSCRDTVLVRCALMGITARKCASTLRISGRRSFTRGSRRLAPQR